MFFKTSAVFAAIAVKAWVDSGKEKSHSPAPAPFTSPVSDSAQLIDQYHFGGVLMMGVGGFILACGLLGLAADPDPEDTWYEKAIMPLIGLMFLAFGLVALFK